VIEEVQHKTYVIAKTVLVSAKNWSFQVFVTLVLSVSCFKKKEERCGYFIFSNYLQATIIWKRITPMDVHHVSVLEIPKVLKNGYTHCKSLIILDESRPVLEIMAIQIKSLMTSKLPPEITLEPRLIFQLLIKMLIKRNSSHSSEGVFWQTNQFVWRTHSIQSVSI